MVPTRAIPLGGSLVLIAALSGCGSSPDNPMVLIGPEAPGTNDTLRAQVAERTGISHEFAWFVDGEEVDDVTTEVPAELTERDQTWRVVVTPIDDETGDAYEPGEATITIGNAAPFGIVVLNPPVARAGVDLVAVPGFTDPDGDEVTYSYAWTNNGTDAGVSGDTVSGGDLVKGDTWEVTVVASDGSAESEPVRASVQVANTPPTVAGARISPDRVLDSSTVDCNPVSWEDADGDPEGYQYLWTVDGVEVSNEPQLTGDLFDRGQRIQCQLTPTDGEDLGAPVESVEVTVENAAPSIGSVTIDQSEPNRNAPITFTATDVNDADGDEIEMQIWWLVNGRGVSQEMELSPELFERGDTVQVRIIPTDGELAGTEVVSSEVTVVNAPPRVVSSSFVTAPIYTDSMLEPRAEIIDADGDEVTVTWTWTVNGTAVGDATGMLSGLDHFDRGDAVQYEIAVTDGTDAGTPYTSASVTVANKPPSIPEVVWNPDPTTPDSNLLCDIVTESVDADGDSVTYDITWDRNGAAYIGLTDTTNFSSDTIPKAALELKQDWTCYVVASDGTDDAETVELETKIRPEDIFYYADDSSDLGGMGSSCTSGGDTGYFGSVRYFGTGQTWTWDDEYDTLPSSATFGWRQGYAFTSNGYRYVYINGSYAGYANLGIGYSSSCDSGRTYTVSISGIDSIWNEGGNNTIEFRPPCCSTYTMGVFYDSTYEYGRLEIVE